MADPEFRSQTFDGDAPSEAELMELAARQVLANFHTIVPGEVVSYDADTGFAEIQPTCQQVTGAGVAEALPPVPGVRVFFLGTAAADFVIEPAPGDTGLLLVPSVCAAQWMEGGDKSAKPESTRRGNLADAVFLPGRLTKPQAHSPGPATRVLISPDGAVTITSANIKLGSASASVPVALATALASHLAAVKTYIDAHVHTSAAPASPTSPPVAPSPSPPDIAAAKVKAE